MSIRVPITAAIGALAIATATAFAAFGGHTTAQQRITTGTMAGATNMSSAQLTGLSASADFAWTPSTTPGITQQVVMTGGSEGGLFSPSNYLSPTVSTARVSWDYNADRYMKLRSWRGSWYSDSAIWSAHSLPMASGTDRVSGTGSGAPLTGPWTTSGSTLFALATSQDGIRYQPPAWQFNIYQNTGFYLDATHAWTGGLIGQIRTFDGTNWTRQTTPTSFTITGITFVDANNGWAIGMGGHIVHSTDGGATWTEQTSGVTENLRGIDCPTTSFCVVVGAAQTQLVTTNGGTTWSLKPPIGINYHLAVECVSTTTCWTVGSDGHVFRSDVGGNEWVPQVSGTTAHLRSISCLDQQRCWAAGDSGTIIRTTNGGTTWSTIPTGSTQRIYAVTMMSSSIGYAGTDTAVWKTTDGGTTWTTLPTPSGLIYQSVSCISTTECIAAADRVTLRTRDGGAHWTELDPQYIELTPRTPPLATATTVTSAKVTVMYRTTAAAPSARFALQASSDNGVTWSTYTLPSTTVADTDVTETIDIMGVGFTPATRAQQVRLRFEVQPPNSTPVTVQIDHVHLNIN